MGISAPAALRAIAAAREAATQATALAEILAESRRAADNTQVLVDQLGTPPEGGTP